MAVSFICWGNRSNRRKPPICRKSLTNFITLCCIEYTLPWMVFELTTLVVIDTDCTGSCKSNYHTIMTTTASLYVMTMKKISHITSLNLFAVVAETRCRNTHLMSNGYNSYYLIDWTVWLVFVSDLLHNTKTFKLWYFDLFLNALILPVVL